MKPELPASYVGTMLVAKPILKHYEVRCDDCVRGSEDLIAGCVAYGPEGFITPPPCKCGKTAIYVLTTSTAPLVLENAQIVDKHTTPDGVEHMEVTGTPRAWKPNVQNIPEGTKVVADYKTTPDSTERIDLAAGRAHVAKRVASEIWAKKEPQAPQDECTFVEFVDPDGWYKARVKWDGCIDLHNYANLPVHLRKPGHTEECDDYIHICDLNEYMKRLEALRVVAQAHFDEHNPGCMGWERPEDK